MRFGFATRPLFCAPGRKGEGTLNGRAKALPRNQRAPVTTLSAVLYERLCFEETDKRERRREALRSLAYAVLASGVELSRSHRAGERRDAAEFLGGDLEPWASVLGVSASDIRRYAKIDYQGVCSFPGCGRALAARGSRKGRPATDGRGRWLCGSHRSQLVKNGECYEIGEKGRPRRRRRKE